MGGVRRHNAELLPRVAERLAACGGHVAILEGSTPIGFPLPPSIERIPSKVPYQPAPMRAALETRALRSVLDEAVRAGSPWDLVHTGHLPAPKQLPAPYTITVHDLRSIDLDRAPFTRRLIGRKILGNAFGRARRIGVVSEWMRSRIESEFSIERERIDVIGNGCDHLPIHPRAPRDSSDAPFLLHVGHLEPRKNLELLLRALAEDPRLPQVILAGRAAAGGWERIEGAAAELGVQDRVTFKEHPTDEEIAALYAACACAVFPSRLEGFGIGPVEAVRASAPVAASRIPAHVEMIGDASRLFDPGDPADLARAVWSAIDSPTSVAALGTPSAPNMKAPRSWDACADAWVQMWVAAVEQPPS